MTGITDQHYDNQGFLHLKVIHRDAWLIIPDLLKLLVDPEDRLISGCYIMTIPGQIVEEEEIYQTITANFLMPIN